MKKKLTLFKIKRKNLEKTTEIYTPKYQSDFEVSKILEAGQEVAGSVSKRDVRNLRFHKKYFALLRLAFSNMPDELKEKLTEMQMQMSEKDIKLRYTLEHFRKEVLMQIGEYDERVSMSGKKYYTPRSIAFANMGAEKFERIYSKTLDFICEYILPGVESEEIEKQIVDFM